ncbi:MAG: hypothetical protein ACRDPZ_06365 [Gaiellaceae bacterium]
MLSGARQCASTAAGKSLGEENLGMNLRGRHLVVLGGAAALAIAVGVLGGAATKGRAAVNQTVTASIVCEPTTAPHGSSTGCLLTVTNNGVNTVTSVTVTDTVSVGAAFLNTSDPLCVISDAESSDDDRVLTCTIAKLAGMASFRETHELQLPSSGTDPVVQTITGRYSPKPNSRGSDNIEKKTTSTILDTNDDFDARWANANAESVHTVFPAALDNPYSTLARVFEGTTPFATGLSVRDDVGESVGGPSPCAPNSCLGGSKIEFHISPPSGLYPLTFEFEISIDGEGADVQPGTKAEDLTIYHVTPQGTFTTPMCPALDPTGDCVDELTVTNGTWDVFARIVGPGTGNGPWGVG